MCNDRSCCGASLQEEERSSSLEPTLSPAMKTQQPLIRTNLERKRTCRQNQYGAKGPSERLPDSHCSLVPTPPPLKSPAKTVTPLSSPAATPHSCGVGHVVGFPPGFESLHKIPLLPRRQKPRLQGWACGLGFSALEAILGFWIQGRVQSIPNPGTCRPPSLIGLEPGLH